ncbi:MAG: L-seryl-tRNA(Sec) selenium transferase [Geobacteraceae bacterium]|nr:L-seryl-tRNA(Sec) selenium transferase [Geobacteraceae bacterium]
MLKNIPKVDKVLEWPAVKVLLGDYPRPVLVKAVRAVLAAVRGELMAGEAGHEALTESGVAERVRRELAAAGAFSLKRVVNGTGVVIHTNLGRSPLPETVRQTLLDVAFGYSNLEFDLERGERGSRYSHVERLLCELTGAEAALVVNNNAAAVLLALSALAAGREAVVSRGELVEIGGSFRIPDVMRQSGAILREVGATNRTHPRDYRNAVTPETGLLLKVHTSNFALVGFTSEVTAHELVDIGREFSLPVMADVGSGNLVDLARILGGGEPTVQEFVRAGVDVVTFSGDKLLGGPQAGIIVGRKNWLELMKKHPLLRAVRIDKLTLAALEGTLRLYRDERQALAEIPTLRMLAATAPELAARGRKLLRRLRRAVPATVSLTLVDGTSQVGGGALPLLELPTSLISVEVAGVSAQKLEVMLRRRDVPVVGRIWKERFLLDLRTIMDDDLPLLLSALSSLGK